MGAEQWNGVGVNTPCAEETQDGKTQDASEEQM